MFYFKKLKLLFNIILVLFVIFMVFFSLFKIFYHNKIPVKDKKYIGFPTLSIHWEKNNYIVPTNNILLPENVPMIVGDYYYIEQSVQTKLHPEKCYMGFLKLQSIKSDRYIFSSQKIFDKSNLFKYAQFNSYKLMVIPIKKEECTKEKNILNCQNWIFLINQKKFDTKNIIHENLLVNNLLEKNIYSYFKMYVNNCLTIPGKNYLVIESMNSNYIYLEYERIYNKIKICAKSAGISIVNFQPIDGSSVFSIKINAVYNNKKTDKFKTKLKKNKSIFVQKNLPGW